MPRELLDSVPEALGEELVDGGGRGDLVVRANGALSLSSIHGGLVEGWNEGHGLSVKLVVVLIGDRWLTGVDPDSHDVAVGVTPVVDGVVVVVGVNDRVSVIWHLDVVGDLHHACEVAVGGLGDL